MAREKTAPDAPNPDEAQSGMEPSAAQDVAAAHPEVGAPAGVVPAPTRTRDRDPADREAWKRQRAAALSIPRD